MFPTSSRTFHPLKRIFCRFIDIYVVGDSGDFKARVVRHGREDFRIIIASEILGLVELLLKVGGHM